MVTAETDATVTGSECYANNALVATAGSSPFGATWSNVATGGYTLTAKMTDSKGGAVTSAPVLVSVTDNTLPLPWAPKV
jgi:hypothetical protein